MSCCIDCEKSLLAAQAKVGLEALLISVPLRAPHLFQMIFQAEWMLMIAYIYVDVSAVCAEPALAAGQLRQVVARTFVSLADTWELGKKFSGEQPGAVAIAHLLLGSRVCLMPAVLRLSCPVFYSAEHNHTRIYDCRVSLAFR